MGRTKDFIDARKNFRLNLSDLSVSECNALSFYMFCIIRNCRNVSFYNEFGDFFFSLAKRLNKMERAEKIISFFVEQLILDKKLSRKRKSKTYSHPFEFRGDLQDNFREDYEIADIFEDWISKDEIQVNLIRAVWNGGDSSILHKIFGMTFFTDREFSEIPEKIAIPSKVRKAAENFAPIQFLIDALGLSEAEAKILIFRYRTSICNEFFAFFLNNDDLNMVDMIAYALEQNRVYVRRALSDEGKLVKFGFLEPSGLMTRGVLETIREKDINIYFKDLVTEIDVKSAYSFDSFSIPEKQAQIAESFLKNDTSLLSEKGVNLLLYGKPGSGKTEFAKTLAKNSGKKCYIFKNETEVAKSDEEEIDVFGRLNCFLSLNNKDSIIIVDEAESILKTISMGFFGPEVDPHKGIVNKMLESTKNNVIWILNYTKECDKSTLRRFTYSIRFDDMPSSIIQKIADTKLAKIKMSQSMHEKIMQLCTRYRVSGASIDNMLKTIECSGAITEKSEGQICSNIKEVLEANSTLLYGKPKMRDRVSSEYDLSVLNATTSAEKIVRMITNAQNFAESNSEGMKNGIRILLYGASGTGKTEFARYISEKLGKSIVLKRASDILGQFVGESEKNIRNAFEEASAKDAILLFDEADSFFADRNFAQHSWERTQVNEFLTQMEEFDGILICTTNLRKIMDPAMQRRFHILSEFKPLAASGISRLLDKYFGSYKFSDEQISSLAKYNSVTPGDFSQLFGKIRFMEKDEISSELIIQELKDIQNEKNGMNLSRIGFCA